jgi:cellulose synthase/poly-beta-1,6-N-acetylglucosamine synthase-like glycosyltransferase
MFLALGISVLGHLFPTIFNFRKGLELIASLKDYLAYAPTYIHLLIIYAFCRIDDLSWGTKGVGTTEKKLNADQEKRALDKLN